MKDRLLRLFCLVAMIAATHCLAYDDLAIWWMIDDPVINGPGSSQTTLGNLVGRGEAEGVSANSVRISMTYSDGSVVYLNLGGEDGQSSTYVGLPGYEIQNGQLVEQWSAGPTTADISPYVNISATEDPGLLFAIEFGNLSGEDWIILAVSEYATYTQLRDRGFIGSSALGIQHTYEWTGGTFSVPEPNALVLLLVGFGMLTLRRRRLS